MGRAVTSFSRQGDVSLCEKRPEEITHLGPLGIMIFRDESLFAAVVSDHRVTCLDKSLRSGRFPGTSGPISRSTWPSLALDSVQHAVLGNLRPFVTLLEEMGDARLTALDVDVAYPVDVHLSALVAMGSLASCDDPLDRPI